MMLQPNQAAKKIENWIINKVEEANGKGVVYGLSGGLDSAVVAVLCKRAFGERSTAVIMPCNGSKEDFEHANLLVKTFELPHKFLDLSNIYDIMVASLDHQLMGSGSELGNAKINLKPRLRMSVLYYLAAALGYLVVGTGNKSEIEIGYFTKYGDGGVDLEPIGHLLKEEVKELAVYLKIPEVIISKQPTAGLWEGQTDEQELGFSYAELDKYLKQGIGSKEIKKKIELLRRNSQHKRQMPPMPEF
ncbi:MAG: NAD(+) synthase [Bacillota bacterium]